MSGIYLEFEGPNVSIRDIERVKSTTTIQEVLMPLEDNCSKSIEHLSKNTWMSREILYQIAQYAHSKQPANTINWHRTFLGIEREFFANKNTESVNIDSYDSYFENMKNRQASITDEITTKLTELVSANLQKYNLT